jgi:hypothetical protein
MRPIKSDHNITLAMITLSGLEFPQKLESTTKIMMASVEGR